MRTNLFKIGFIAFFSTIGFVVGIMYLKDIKLQKSNFNFSVILKFEFENNEVDEVFPF